MHRIQLKQYALTTIAVLMFTFISGCSSTGVPKGITPKAGFELERYLGTWYEIARLDHKFERGLESVTATYSLNDDGSVKVTNSGVSVKTGKLKQAIGKARFVGPNDIAHLKVSFFGPFYGSYIVYELDEQDYQYALVAGPDRSYMWVLSRTPQIEAEQYDALMQIAVDNGFDTNALIKVKHDSGN